MNQKNTQRNFKPKIKEIILYPIDSIQILVNNQDGVLVKGPKGIALVKKCSSLQISFIKGSLIGVTDSKNYSKLISFKAEFNKIISSVIYGFFCRISLEGLSYKVEKFNNELIFSLGLSHTKIYRIPETTRIELESQRSFCIYGVDPREVSLVSDQILNLKKKEIYKKRGFIFHENPKKNWYSENEQIKVLNKKK